MVKQEINDKQARIAGLLIRSFRLNYNGPGKKIKSDKIIENLRLRNFKIDGGELREVIGHIRRFDLCAPGFILSDNTGYWYSEDADEMESVWESEFSRARNILLNFKPLRRRYKSLIGQRNAMFVENFSEKTA